MLIMMLLTNAFLLGCINAESVERTIIQDSLFICVCHNEKSQFFIKLSGVITAWSQRRRLHYQERVFKMSDLELSTL